MSIIKNITSMKFKLKNKAFNMDKSYIIEFSSLSYIIDMTIEVMNINHQNTAVFLKKYLNLHVINNSLSHTCYILLINIIHVTNKN
jgi:hypothetical protein